MKTPSTLAGVLLLSLAAAACDKGGSDTKALEARIAKLEKEASTNAPAMQFLNEAYKGEKNRREQEERREPAPDAVFAVDINGNQIHGPASGAYVTIVEAWDFA